MGYQWRLSAVFFIIGSFAAARPVFGKAAGGKDAHKDALPATDKKRSATQNLVDGGQDSTLIDSPPAPYEGVARRKPASAPTAFCYLSSVLRPRGSQRFTKSR